MQANKKIWQTIIVCLGIMLGSDVYAESVALQWDAPTTNTDDTALTDLAGFNIYQGTATGVYGSPIDVGNKLCTIIGGLTAGTTHYFAATAYDGDANESAYSNEVSKLIASGDMGNCNYPTHMNWKARTKNSGGFKGGFR